MFACSPRLVNCGVEGPVCGRRGNKGSRAIDVGGDTRLVWQRESGGSQVTMIRAKVASGGIRRRDVGSSCGLCLLSLHGDGWTVHGLISAALPSLFLRISTNRGTVYHVVAEGLKG